MVRLVVLVNNVGPRHRPCGTPSSCQSRGGSFMWVRKKRSLPALPAVTQSPNYQNAPLINAVIPNANVKNIFHTLEANFAPREIAVLPDFRARNSIPPLRNNFSGAGVGPIRKRRRVQQETILIKVGAYREICKSCNWGRRFAAKGTWKEWENVLV